MTIKEIALLISMVHRYVGNEQEHDTALWILNRELTLKVMNPILPKETDVLSLDVKHIQISSSEDGDK